MDMAIPRLSGPSNRHGCHRDPFASHGSRGRCRDLFHFFVLTGIQTVMGFDLWRMTVWPTFICDFVPVFVTVYRTAVGFVGSRRSGQLRTQSTSLLTMQRSAKPPPIGRQSSGGNLGCYVLGRSFIQGVKNRPCGTVFQGLNQKH